MVEFSLVSYEVIHSGIAEPVHRRTSQPTSTFECRSSVEKVRFGFDPFAEHPATANVEGRGFSLVGFVNHSPAARKPSLGRNLDGNKAQVVTCCDATLRFQSERHRKPPVRRQVLETIVRSHGPELSDVNELIVPFDSEDFPEKVRRPRQAMLAVDAVGRFQMTSR